MKSLLVDVLRQAQDESSEEKPAPSLAEDARGDGPSAAEETVKGAELDLLATNEFRTEEAVAGEVVDPLTARLDDPADVDESSLPSRQRPLADSAALNENGAVLQSRTPAILRIARLTPLICLVAAIGVAVGSLFVDRVTRSSLNDSLDELANIGQGADPNRATDRAEFRNRLFGAVRSDGNSTTGTSKVAATPVAAVDGNAARAAVVAGDGRPDTTIDVSRSNTGPGRIDDRAFELVAAGYAAYQQRDYGAAERYYDQALALEANHRDALLGIAAVFGQTNRHEQAHDAYRKVLQIEPGNTIAASAILSARAADARWDNESDLKLLLQQFPDAHHLHFALGTIYVGEQRWAAARHAFLAAWQLAPANPSYAYNLAVSCERLGDVVEAAKYFETALAYADENSNVDRAAVEMHLSQLAIIARDDR